MLHHPYYDSHFESPPPYGRLICLPKSRPHFQVHELIEYGDEVIRNPIGRAWQQGHIILDMPTGIYELVPMDGMQGFRTPTQTPPSTAAKSMPVAPKSQQTALHTH